MKKVLHPGCGPKRVVGRSPLFPESDWTETRVDAGPAATPDVVAAMTDMTAVPDASHDAVYSAHGLEYLFPHELPVALAEFRRILKPGGFVLVRVSNIQKAAAAIMAGRWDQPLNERAGETTPLELLFGREAATEGGEPHSGRRNGFVPRTLGKALKLAGFVEIQVAATGMDIMAIGYKDRRPADGPRLSS